VWHHRLGLLFELANYTGLRPGEICGLHWADVDLAGRQIVVRHNRVSVDGRVQETTTKTRSGCTVGAHGAHGYSASPWRLRLTPCRLRVGPAIGIPWQV
jgi:integrase